MSAPLPVGQRREASGIVLAGGRASRFGSDKLAVHVGGTTLLVRAIDAVGRVCGEVIVVGRDPAGRIGLPRNVRHVPDSHALAGPLAALRDGATAATSGTLLVVGGDMPELVTGVLEALLDAVGGGVEAAVLVADGSARPLPMAVRRDAALQGAEACLDAGDGSLRGLVGRLATSHIDEALWRASDAEGRTLRDIDRRSDLPD